MSIKDWIIHPLSLLSTSNDSISNVEQRQYLYDQERLLEKAIRYNEWIPDTINSFIRSREDEIKTILSYNGRQQNIQVNELQNIWWWIKWLWDKIDYWMWALLYWIQKLNENQIISLQETLKALWLINYDIKEWFMDMLDSISKQTLIFKDISSEIWKILETLNNPRKIEWLEYKRDALSYLQNKWFDEALEYLKLAIEKLTTDQEVYYLIWLIEFEEKKNYEEAIVNFEKAIKYASWYNDINIYIQSLDKLASIYFILAWKDWEQSNSYLKKAFNYQLEVVDKYGINNVNYIYSLLKYSAIIWDKEILKLYLYKILKSNPSLLVKILLDPIFRNKEWIIDIIDNVNKKIISEKKEKEKEKREKEIIGFEKWVMQEIGKLCDNYYLKYDYVWEFYWWFAMISKNWKINFINEKGDILSPNEWFLPNTKNFYNDAFYAAVKCEERKYWTIYSEYKLLWKNWKILDVLVTNDYWDWTYQIREPAMYNIVLKNGKLLNNTESFKPREIFTWALRYNIWDMYIENCSRFSYKDGYWLFSYSNGKIYKYYLNWKKELIDKEDYMKKHFSESEKAHYTYESMQFWEQKGNLIIIRNFNSLVENKSYKQIDDWTYKLIKKWLLYNFEDKNWKLLFKPTKNEIIEIIEKLLKYFKEYKISKEWNLITIVIYNSYNIFDIDKMEFINKEWLNK